MWFNITHSGQSNSNILTMIRLTKFHNYNSNCAGVTLVLWYIPSNGLCSPSISAGYSNVRYLSGSEQRGSSFRYIFFGCILYADDIVLISPSVHSLQLMLDVCASFDQEVDMRFTSNKSVVMRVGSRFKLPCKPVMLCDKPLSFVNEAKYLGVCCRG